MGEFSQPDSPPTLMFALKLSQEGEWREQELDMQVEHKDQPDVIFEWDRELIFLKT